MVCTYDQRLIYNKSKDLGYARGSLAGTIVGNYALFGGGRYDSGVTPRVDAYYINNKVLVYPGTKYKLGGMTSESTASSMQMIETTTPITGYIKIKNATIN